MRYLCTKQLTAGGVTYHPGEIIPDGVIWPERSGKLLKSGYLSEWKEGIVPTMLEGKGKLSPISGYSEIFTQEEVAGMIAEAVDRAVSEAEKKWADRLAELQEYTAVLEETNLGAYDGTLTIAVRGSSDGENEAYTVVPASVEEMKQVFAILQLNAEESVKAIADVKSENVLILLHAADSRKTVKNAAKERAEKLFSMQEVPNESGNGNEITGTNAEGAGT